MPKSLANQFIEEMGLQNKFKEWSKNRKKSQDEYDYGEFLSDELTYYDLEPNKFYALIGNKEMPAGRTLDDTYIVYLGGSYMGSYFHKGKFREITEESFLKILEKFNKKLYGKKI